jgi:DNA-directed RNA polymerase specialized sigma24 family protein
MRRATACFGTGTSRGDQTAFAALVERHGPMVLGVCRRVLRHTQDAEDAFQATFLVLAHKARAVNRPDLLGAWPYGVAYRTALKARGRAGTRQPERLRSDVPARPSTGSVEADVNASRFEETRRPVLENPSPGVPGAAWARRDVLDSQRRPIVSDVGSSDHAGDRDGAREILAWLDAEALGQE